MSQFEIDIKSNNLLIKDLAEEVCTIRITTFFKKD